MIKALFFDLDGTLLNREKTISQKTREALEKCKEKGMKLFVTTARPPLLDKMLCWDNKTLTLFDGGSYLNGGCIKINGEKEYIPISDDIVMNAINYVYNYENLNIALQLEGEKHAFRFILEEKARKSWGIPLNYCLELDGVNDLKTIKILIFYENFIDSVTYIENSLISSLSNLCHSKAQFYIEGGKCAVITGKSVNKYESIEKIRLKFNFEKDEIAVFGDDINDIEMLSEYKFSVAMGNAENYIKNAATYITLDNDSDGIYHAICNILRLV